MHTCNCEGFFVLRKLEVCRWIGQFQLLSPRTRVADFHTCIMHFNKSALRVHLQVGHALSEHALNGNWPSSSSQNHISFSAVLFAHLTRNLDNPFFFHSVLFVRIEQVTWIATNMKRTNKSLWLWLRMSGNIGQTIRVKILFYWPNDTLEWTWFPLITYMNEYRHENLTGILTMFKRRFC